jgi:hypothetical protein
MYYHVLQDKNWTAASASVAKKWWRCDELWNSNTKQSMVHQKEPSPDIVSIILKRNPVPMEEGEKDAVDELLWLLDHEDTSPIVVALETMEMGE